MDNKFETDEMYPATNEHIVISNKLDQYKGEFGTYKPSFKGRHENYYPNKWYDWILQTLICFPVLIVLGLLMWGYLAWGFASPVSYGWYMFGTYIGTFVLLNILVFIFGRDRRKRERECIAAKYKENMEKRQKRKVEAEENAKMLREYQKAHNDLKGISEEFAF